MTSKPAMACCSVPSAGVPRSPLHPQPAAGADPRAELAADDADIAWFDGGKSWLGTDVPAIKADGEGPRRPTKLRPFGMERFAVTNRRYAAFVETTGYRTDAERLGWSFVFAAFAGEGTEHRAVRDTPWWRAIEGASWAAPEGPGSTIDDRQDHPAVHLSWNDAIAFATACGGRLPSEAEWEHAARGGNDDRRFPWGNEEPSDTSPLCNIWQGRFPAQNTCADGYFGTAPVDAFAPNPAGLYNCCGNVWEWNAEAFRVRTLALGGRQRNAQAGAEQERVLKGGSYLCHRSYCYRYRIAARIGRAPDTSAGHMGMRVAFDVKPA